MKPIRIRSSLQSAILVLAGLAVSTPTSAQSGCTEEDQRLIKAVSECMKLAASGGVCKDLETLGQRLQRDLSKSCQAALAQQAQQLQSGSQAFPDSPPHR